MRTVVLASLRRHTRRYVAAVLAVAIGVAFVVVTDAIASSARNGLTAGLDAPYAHADSVIDMPDVETARKAMAEHGDRVAAQVFDYQPVSVGGRTVDEVTIGAVTTVPELRWQDLTDGRWPSGPDEALLDTNAAEQQDVAVGDTVRVGRGAGATDVTVVGTADSPSQMQRATVYLTWPALMTLGGDGPSGQLFIQNLTVVGPDLHLPGYDATSPQDYVDALLLDANNQIDLARILVLLFGAVAFGVAALVIANTFSILFAQRRREIALLRCLGATGRAVRRAIRLEALLIGLGASAIGVVGGALLGWGLVAGVRAGFEDAPLAEVGYNPLWLLAGFLVGVVTTLVAAWWPTRQALRVSPLAALRPDDAVTVRSRPGVLRLVTGGLLLVAGGLGLGAAVAATDDLVMVGGGAVFFVGVLVLGPVIVPGLIHGARRLAGPLLGHTGRLAAANATRNPKRTAATTAALLVGVTLSAAVMAGMSSTRVGTVALMESDHPIDMALTTQQPVDRAGLDRVADTDGVADAVAVPGTSATLEGAGGPGGTGVTLLAPARDDVRDVLLDDGVLPRPGTVVISYDVETDLADSRRVAVTVGGRTEHLTVVRDEGFGPAALVTPETLRDLAPKGAGSRAVWVDADADVDADELAGQLTQALGGDPDLDNGVAQRAWVTLQLDVMLWAVLGLLGVGVAIALVGIANTLGLSVLERTREHALLRALGLTRRQLRRMLAVEGMLLAVVAAVLGIGIGLLFAAVGMAVLVDPALPGVGLTLPWLQLAGALVVAALAGLLAAVLPSRRAARITPAAGLTVE